jgi:hypothetical protein
MCDTGSMQGSRSRFLLRVSKYLCLAQCSVHQARTWSQLHHSNVDIVSGAEAAPIALQRADDEREYQPPGLKQVYEFCTTLLHTDAYKQGKAIVVCSGSDPKDVTNTALLLGGFMILAEGCTLDAVRDAFEPVSHRFAEYDDGLAVHDCWSSLHHVHTRCGWLRLDSKLSLRLLQRCAGGGDDAEAMDMEEYMHYDSPLNGGLHVLVPDRLLVLHCPEDLPGGAAWADAGGVRRFGAAHYADILGDFGVDVVVRGGGDACGYDASAFAAQGIEVEDLALLDAGGVPTLAEIDRFLSLARHASGAVAVHGGAGRGLGAAGTLIAAHLIREHRFLAKDAIAWVRMIHPDALPAPHQRFLRAAEADVRRPRHRSMPSFAAAGGGGEEGGDGDAAGRAAGGWCGAGVEGLGAGMPRSVSAPRIFDFLDGGAVDAAAPDVAAPI